MRMIDLVALSIAVLAAISSQAVADLSDRSSTVEGPGLMGVVSLGSLESGWSATIPLSTVANEMPIVSSQRMSNFVHYANFVFGSGGPAAEPGAPFPIEAPFATDDPIVPPLDLEIEVPFVGEFLGQTGLEPPSDPGPSPGGGGGGGLDDSPTAPFPAPGACLLGVMGLGLVDRLRRKSQNS